MDTATIMASLRNGEIVEGEVMTTLLVTLEEKQSALCWHLMAKEGWDEEDLMFERIEIMLPLLEASRRIDTDDHRELCLYLLEWKARPVPTSG